MDEQFEQLVSEAIDHIPAQYQEKMKHVAIIVEDMPAQEQRQKLGLRHCDALFGLYEGVPLPQRGGYTLQIPPDKITIFKHPMVELFPDIASLKKQIYKTLWHEVAHLFGLNHDQIHKASK
ncbi:metallopeptidase family protein [Candidatus Saccharibacteria bacterium]|nr:metallopeptidase family protein [Candidatus Saccharibacteria bacterium]MCA9328634.1 metallopeptidase family protein [Candidatus Saccharibacteria bacterium]